MTQSETAVVITFRTSAEMLARIDNEKKGRQTRSEWIRQTIELRLAEGEQRE